MRPANDNRGGDGRKPDDLAALTEEAKSLWVPRPESPDLATEAERRLFASLDAHDAEVARRTVSGGAVGFWGPVALIVAVAAGVALYSHPRGGGVASDGSAEPAGSVAPLDVEVSTRPTAPAELASVSEGGELRVDGAKVGPAGLALRDGESLEARGGVASFVAPGRVAWLLESGTEVTALRSGTRGGSIVLGLRVGAVEAQVTPVPAGEAFAVDVDGVRVAVHGTHLRVARAERGGSWVVVDLSEGVISVGAPPKAGSTMGVLVTAPAHVEFSTTDVDHTLRVEHDPARVRAPVDPVSIGSRVDSLRATALEAPESAAQDTPDEKSGDSPATPRSTHPVSHPPPAAPVPAVVAPRAPPTPIERLATAVRNCADQTTHDANGSLTISSMMTVEVKADGSAGLAKFDPPLAPDLQACVANTVYAIHWGAPGALRIPIELHR
jgi:hypothetical protein